LNALEEEEELSNNVPNPKLSHDEKANLLRYVYCNILYVFIFESLIFISFIHFYLDFSEKHFELRNKFDRLDRLTAKGPNHKEFVEPNVQTLWRFAREANFSPDELTSLKV